MLAIAQSAVLAGIASHPVRVEVQASRGIPSFELVGLAEAAVRESRVRVKSALAGIGVDISEVRVVVNLAPADVKKSGSSFDLAIALGTLVALEILPQDCLDGVLLLGELSLNGHVQSLRGLVAHLLAAKGRGVARAIVPSFNEGEAALVDGMLVEIVSSLEEVVGSMRDGSALRRPAPEAPRARLPCDDMSDVRGQEGARRALEVAASGAHNLLMMGPPGAGKTMLARRLPGILPLLTRDEALEVIAIHGVAGTLGPARVIAERPFRAPHHTVSDVALVGGGDTVRPGEVSLAHHGVLFLDELAEMRRPALEALRQPLEDGVVTISRSRMTATYPARPMLIAATNPCPCGNRGDGTRRCTCRLDAVESYRRRLSGPLLDRIDLHVVLPRVDVLSFASVSLRESSLTVRGRVEAARAIQRERHQKREVGATVNARLSQRDVERVCQLSPKGQTMLAQAVERRGLSGRAYGKILRVARTLADMDGSAAIRERHIGEAILGRVLDREPHGSAEAALHPL